MRKSGQNVSKSVILFISSARTVEKGMENRKGNDMPKKKTVSKKGAQNFDSFKSGKNERLDPRFKHYEIDPDDVFDTALDVQDGNETDELKAAEKERARRQKISASKSATRAAGRMFEEMILRACEAYKEKGIAVINKVPEARRVVGRTGGRTSMMICVNDKKADPDFEGSVAPNGRCIIFDAKHTAKDRILSQALSDHQVEIREKHFVCGSDCYVCVSFNFERFFMIPYGEIGRAHV